MELKSYQQHNLNEIERYLTLIEQDPKHNYVEAFRTFWRTNRPAYEPCRGTAIEPYKDNVRHAPHICCKVPTGGGKTLLASAALRVLFNHIHTACQMVVWLVPSTTILDQTLHHLNNPHHPYRQRIDVDFNSRVLVFDKQQALLGQGFSLSAVKENLCIMIATFDSFRATNKDGRKVYQDNGYLQSFAGLPGATADEAGEIQLMSVLRALHPVVIVDESHNANTPLSEDMLNDMAPSIVLDLTATPKQNSNIICFTDALELKRNNMVKLPVIVYNHTNKNQVIDSALHLQRSLEQTARQDPTRYIRPIVLFQAEPKNKAEERETFDKIREKLTALHIPEEQIKIKTADINELTGVDLMSPDCPVRYIITINALKEGWDCPFAYILASLADKSSSVDVEQIVGRVLRLPYARRNNADVLNLSYVLTASAKFQDTLQSVVAGLNHAGFSARDYRSMDMAESDAPTPSAAPTLQILFPEEAHPQTTTTNIDDIDPTAIRFDGRTDMAEQTQTPIIGDNKEVAQILATAQQQATDMETQMQQQTGEQVPVELAESVKRATIQSLYAETAKAICLPQFFIRDVSSPGNIFGEASDHLLEGEDLLQGFRLSAQETPPFSFERAETSLYKVDISDQTDDHTPRYEKIKGSAYDLILNYIRDADNIDSKRTRCSSEVAALMGKMIPLTQKDVQYYIEQRFIDFKEADFEQFLLHINEYTQVLKQDIVALENRYKQQQFRRGLDTDQIFVRPAFSIPDEIVLSAPQDSITKMLHTREEDVNGFEKQVINEVANLENVKWWTRNRERKDFFINGFINHYPDFIIHTKRGKTVLLETKGDHLDAADKILLGNMWANKAGSKYRYFLVYQNRKEDGAYTYPEFIDILRLL